MVSAYYLFCYDVTMNIKGLKIYLIYGKKGSGKSLYMAKLAQRLFDSYKWQEKKYPTLPRRKLYSNMKYSDEVDKKELGKHLEYWENPEQIYRVRNSDILWDEIGKDLPAGSWADTPKEIKQVFSHLRKRGNRLFANTQVYEDCDVSFRRQCDFAFQIQKVFGSKDVSASLPPPRFIWGILMMRQFDPLQLEYERDPEKREELQLSWFPSFMLVKRSLIEMYDTHAEIPPYQPNKLREIILTCREGELCQDKDKHGLPHKKIKHVPV